MDQFLFVATRRSVLKGQGHGLISFVSMSWSIPCAFFLFFYFLLQWWFGEKGQKKKKEKAFEDFCESWFIYTLHACVFSQNMTNILKNEFFGIFLEGA